MEPQVRIYHAGGEIPNFLARYACPYIARRHKGIVIANGEDYASSPQIIWPSIGLMVDLRKELDHEDKNVLVRNLQHLVDSGLNPANIVTDERMSRKINLPTLQDILRAHMALRFAGC